LSILTTKSKILPPVNPPLFDDIAPRHIDTVVDRRGVETAVVLDEEALEGGLCGGGEPAVVANGDEVGGGVCVESSACRLVADGTAVSYGVDG